MGLRRWYEYSNRIDTYTYWCICHIIDPLSEAITGRSNRPESQISVFLAPENSSQLSHFQPGACVHVHHLKRRRWPQQTTMSVSTRVHPSRRKTLPTKSSLNKHHDRKLHTSLMLSYASQHSFWYLTGLREVQLPTTWCS